MDFLNTAFAQLNEFFRSMTPAARITAALLLAVVVISLAYLVNTQVAGPDAFLLNGQNFSPKEMQKVESALGTAGLGDYEIEGTKVRIPRGKQDVYMAALAAGDALPRNFGDYLDRIVNESSPLISKSQQKQREHVAKQQELSSLIGHFDGIVNAAVLYDTKMDGPFNRNAHTTASVQIEAINSSVLDEQKIKAIRNLVSHAVAGLDPKDVSITDTQGRNWSGMSSDGSGSASEDPYLARMREYQRDFEENIRKALSYIPSLTVKSNVVLDREIRSTSAKVNYDKNAVPIRTVNDSSFSTTIGQGPAGRPGVASQSANQGASIAAAPVPGPKSEDETSSEEILQAIPHEETNVVMHGMTPTQVTVAVGIPTSYLREVWQQRNPTAEGEEPGIPEDAELALIQDEVTAGIQSTVLNLIPVSETVTDPASLVSVNTFQHIPGPAIEEAGMSTAAVGWFGQQWATLAMIGLGGFSLLMFRSTLRSAATPAEPTRLPNAPKPTGGSPDNDEVAAPENRLRGLRVSGPSLQEDLSEMVQEDPAVAARIIENWISSAT